MINTKPVTVPALPEAAPARTAARAGTLKTKGAPKAKPLSKAKHDRRPQSKQDRVLAMLRQREGTTIASVMKATGWQKHSVHGFLSGVVRKKLKLKLASTKVADKRIYRIDAKTRPKASGRQAKWHPA